MVDVVLKTEKGKSSSPRIRFNMLLLPALVSPVKRDILNNLDTWQNLLMVEILNG